ncbi:radical SAM protein [Candidatus Thorarchaeota archaeon]|nr:MAG: radical SAM protein [Candidatus Thorarchaeota archaeon]
MTTLEKYPYHHHPCYSESRKDLWARIHLPVARICNVKCVFCDHSVGSSCHTSKPGYAASLMNPKEAISRTMQEVEMNPRLKIVAVSGPGEPLANEETYTTLEGIRSRNTELFFCLSTNGVLVEDTISRLEKLGITTISVSMSAIYPETAAQVYEWALIDGERLRGQEMGEMIIMKQLSGIERAVDSGITVKVNTVLIPNINLSDISSLSKQISELGVSLQNIVPLVPNVNTSKLVPPTSEELNQARQMGSINIPQFTHCKQCRSDVVGIPGDDRIL